MCIVDKLIVRVVLPFHEAAAILCDMSPRGSNIGQSLGGQVFTLLLLGLLCVGVTLQMLGVSVAFWDLDGSSDLVESLLLEGFAVLFGEPVLPPLLQFLFASVWITLVYRLLRPHILFHPPVPVL
jgi:hypothetical protein